VLVGQLKLGVNESAREAERQIQVVSEKDAEDFTETLLRIAGRTKNPPPDLARNHDYYLRGLPKK